MILDFSLISINDYLFHERTQEGFALDKITIF